MKYAFYLTVVVTSTFVNGSSISTSMYDQTSTISSPSMIISIKSSLSASENASVIMLGSVNMSSSMRSLAFSVSDTTTSNTLLRQSSTAKSSNAEGESKTPYSASIVTRSNPTAMKTKSVNQTSASIQATGTIKGTIKGIRSQSLAMVKASDSVKTGTSSSSMIKPTVVMTRTLTKNSTTASTIEMRSSLSFVPNTDTQPGEVISTTSPVINVNGSSSIMNGTTMVAAAGLISATMSTPNVTGSLVVNAPMSTVDIGSPVIKNTTMKTTMLKKPTTSVTPTVTKESPTDNATMNTTIVSNPAISIMTSINKSSHEVNVFISSVTTLSISRNVLTSTLMTSAINVNGTSSHFVQSIHPTNTSVTMFSSAVTQTMSPTAANLSTMPAANLSNTPAANLSNTPAANLSTMAPVENTTSLTKTVPDSHTILSVSLTSNVTASAPTTSDGNDNKALIVYIVFGSVLGLAFLIGIIGLIVHCHRGQSTGMFHLPGEENLELSGFSGHNVPNFRGGNFYGDLQPESSEHRLSRIPNESDPVTDNLEGNTENGASFGGAYLPAWKSLQTVDVPDVSRKDQDSSEMNDYLVLTYGKTSDQDRRDSFENKGFVASDHKVGAV